MIHSSDQWAFLQDVGKLIAFAADKGYSLTGDELYRTSVEAWVNSLPPKCTLTALTPDGKELHYWESVGGKGIQNSLHTVRLAIDLNLIMPDGSLAATVEQYREIGTYWESLSPNNRWGGNFTSRVDCDHFQRTVQ